MARQYLLEDEENPEESYADRLKRQYREIAGLSPTGDPVPVKSPEMGMDIPDRSPQAQAAFETEPQGQMPQTPSKPGLKDQLKEYLLGMSSSTPEMDEYGVQKPRAKNPSVVGSILNIALPALAAAYRGEGLIPGAMMGIAGNRNRAQRSLDTDLKRYETEQKAATGRENQRSLNDYRSNRLNFQRDNLEERGRYHQTLGETSKQKANASTIRAKAYQDRVGNLNSQPPKNSRASSVPNRDKYIDITDRIKKGQPVTPGEMDWVEKQQQIYKKQGASSSKKTTMTPEQLQEAFSKI